jgi:hypothetical protein
MPSEARFVHCGEKMAARGEHKGGDIVQGVGKVEAAENHYEDGKILIHSLEQPVEGERG